MLEFLAAMAAALVGAAVLLTHKEELNRWATTTPLWFTEVAVVTVSFVVLGWMGLVLVLTVLVVALQVESALVASISRGKLDMPKAGLKKLHRSLHGSDWNLAHVSRVQSAELI